MTATRKETIRLGEVEVRFHPESADTAGALAMFEFLVSPGSRVPIPQNHIAYDETLYGIEGVVSFTVEGHRSDVGPGDTLFIPRGAVHDFVNAGSVTRRTLAVITPALLSADFFRGFAAALSAGGPPDPKKPGEIMLRHGLKPAPPPA